MHVEYSRLCNISSPNDKMVNLTERIYHKHHARRI